jgi:hypothetical protein
MITNLKIETGVFARITEGKHEIALASDAPAMQTGDTVMLEEWDLDSQEYTGRKVEAVVTTMLDPTAEDKAGMRRIRFEPKNSKYTPSV